MKQSKRLQPIHDYKLRQEDEAAKRLANVSREVALKKKSLSDLESYCGEYDQQFQESSGQGISAKRMKEYQVFMTNLGKVVDQQKTAIETLEKDFDMKKRQWIAAKNRTKALAKIQYNHQKKESSQEEKAQQKEQDDRGVRLPRHL